MRTALTLALSTSLLTSAVACGDDAGVDPSPTDVTAPPSATLLAGHPGAGSLEPHGTAPRVIGVTALTTCPQDPDTVYVADTFGTAIYAVSVSTRRTRLVAGAPGAAELADGPPDRARFASPRAIACVPSGDALIVADSGAFRRIALPEGEVSTVAGFPGTAGNIDGDATTARIGYLIHAMVVTPTGDAIVFSDRSANSLRRLDLGDLSVTTVSPRAEGWDGPGGLAFGGGPDPTLYAADTFNDRIVTVDLSTGALSAVASTPAPQGVAVRGEPGRGGLMVAGGFDGPLVQIDAENGTTRAIDAPWTGTFASPIFAGPEGEQLVVAPLGIDSVVSLDIDAGDLTATSHTLLGPDPDRAAAPASTPLSDWHPAQVGGVVAAPDGRTLFATDAGLGLLVRLDLAAGVASEVPLDTIPREDGDDTPIALRAPAGLALSSDGTRLAISDPGAGAVYVLTLDAELRPLTGRRVGGPMRGPTALVIAPAHEAPRPEPDSHLYIAETGGHRVLRVALADPDGGVQVVAGTGQPGYRDGPPGEAQLLGPRALWVDATRSLVLIGEEEGRSLRALTRSPNGTAMVVSTWIAPPADPEALPRDGALATAVLGGISALHAPSPATLLVADGGAFTLRAVRLSAEGLPVAIETVAGRSGAPGGVSLGASAPLAAAIFGSFGGLALLGDGRLVVATDAALLGLETPEGGW